VLLDAVEAQMSTLLVALGENIRQVDDLLERAREESIQDNQDLADVIAGLQKMRADAFAMIARHLPEEAYVWTPDMQAKIRQSEADIAAGRSHIFLNEADMDALFMDEWRALSPAQRAVIAEMRKPNCPLLSVAGSG
jgi:hypothetical protein